MRRYPLPVKSLRMTGTVYQLMQQRGPAVRLRKKLLSRRHHNFIRQRAVIMFNPCGVKHPDHPVHHARTEYAVLIHRRGLFRRSRNLCRQPLTLLSVEQLHGFEHGHGFHQRFTVTVIKAVAFAILRLLRPVLINHRQGGFPSTRVQDRVCLLRELSPIPVQVVMPPAPEIPVTLMPARLLAIALA